MALPPGSRLGCYEIVSLLGSGGMGEVYRAKDTKLGRDVAVKVLRQDLAQDGARLKRFEREARAASALNHPNIVSIYDIGDQEGTRFIAMELVEGRPLQDVFADGPLPAKKLLPLATQIAAGLAKAHGAGIVHRDLKPDNVIVSRDGHVKIVDFGLAKLRQDSAPFDSELPTVERMETEQGVVLGTIGYMSPEQARGQAADFRSDQFALGVVLYEAATGRRPFQRASAAETISAILKEEPEAIGALNARIPAPFAGVVERCLAKEPQDRYDSTRDLVRELQDLGLSGPAVASKEVPARRRSGAAVVAAAGLVAIALVGIYASNLGNLRDETGSSDARAVQSIAVLPLENLSGDPEQEYFAAGMHEALITDLSKVGALKVISRTSVMRYEETSKSVPEIAAELGVDAVVEGSVQRAGNRVRITAQLVHGRTDEHLWAESYDKDLEDVLTLQSEVARAIVGQIQVALTPEETALLAESRPVDPKAYELYLKGRHHWSQATEEGFWKSIESFQQALEKDPSFALAHVGLAESYATFGMNMVSSEEAGSKVRFHAAKAVELDDGLDEAHRMLALIAIQNWNWAAAEKELKRALELNPSSAYAHNMYSRVLMRLGRFEEMVEEEEAAMKLNPLSHYIHCDAGFVYFFANRETEAINQARQTTELFGNACPYENLVVGKTYNRSGMYEDAILELERRKALQEEDPRTMAELGYAYALAGRSDEAHRILDELEELATRKAVDPYVSAAIHVALGDEDEAFRLLEEAYRQRSFFVSFLGADPEFAPLRTDPRFTDLLGRMNLLEDSGS